SRGRVLYSRLILTSCTKGYEPDPGRVSCRPCEATVQDARYDEINDASGTVPALPLPMFNLCTISLFCLMHIER
ncbi:uncharacterized, partial [Tachysurus ichikawai]